jgi:SNF2 family DNA or RNA helicase
LKQYYDGATDKEKNISRINKIKKYHKDPKQICRLSSRFNIFRIKWNRVYIDEGHEKLCPVIKMFSTSMNKYFNESKLHYEDQFQYENIVTINSNYKWVMTGTPSEHGIDSIMGMLSFLTKKDYNEDIMPRIEKIRYFSNLLGISRDNFDKLLTRIFKKTFKKDVKPVLNIPIFTEEIIYLDQTNIERNIYNTIRCSRHFTEHVRIRRLFLMCTNILINEGYDLEGNNDITTEVLTLEQLNANMITKFTQQLQTFEKTEAQIKKSIIDNNELCQKWKIAHNYIKTLNLENIIPPEIYKEIETKIGHVISTHLIFYNLLNVFECYNDPSSIGNTMISNLYTIKDSLIRIWNKTWDNENVLTKCSEYGTKMGEQKIKDENLRNQRKLDTIVNDKKRINNQIALFSNNEFLKEKTSDPCIICFEDLNDVVVTQCRHVFCLGCTKQLSNQLKNNFTCPECRTPITCNTLNITNISHINCENKPETIHEVNTKQDNNITKLEPKTRIEKLLGIEWKNKCINKYGSKMTTLVEYLYNLFENVQNRVIIFSQYDKMLRLIGKTLEEFEIKFVYCSGNNFTLNKNINRFKKDESIRVIMLSSETSNSGSNLTEANYIIFIDVLFHEMEEVKAIEAQAIGRAVRLGQTLPVKVVRFITRGTIEDEHFTKNRYDMNTLQE